MAEAAIVEEATLAAGPSNQAPEASGELHAWCRRKRCRCRSGAEGEAYTAAAGAFVTTPSGRVASLVASCCATMATAEQLRMRRVTAGMQLPAAAKELPAFATTGLQPVVATLLTPGGPASCQQQAETWFHALAHSVAATRGFSSAGMAPDADKHETTQSRLTFSHRVRACGTPVLRCSLCPSSRLGQLWRSSGRAAHWGLAAAWLACTRINN
jgi:hypothetical protein